MEVIISLSYLTRIKEVNELSSDEVRAGDKLLIVKGA